jgi:hypothetical protein
MDTIRLVIFFIFLSSYLPIFLLLDPPQKLLTKAVIVCNLEESLCKP